jgi:hypothetical protein
MMSLLTPTRSEVDNAKTSLFFVKETWKLRLFLLAGFGANTYSFVWDSWVQQYLLEFAFSLYYFFAFYRRLGFALLWLLS